VCRRLGSAPAGGVSSPTSGWDGQRDMGDSAGAWLLCAADRYECVCRDPERGARTASRPCRANRIRLRDSQSCSDLRQVYGRKGNVRASSLSRLQSKPFMNTPGSIYVTNVRVFVRALWTGRLIGRASCLLPSPLVLEGSANNHTSATEIDCSGSGMSLVQENQRLRRSDVSRGDGLHREDCGTLRLLELAVRSSIEPVFSWSSR